MATAPSYITGDVAGHGLASLAGYSVNPAAPEGYVPPPTATGYAAPLSASAIANQMATFGWVDNPYGTSPDHSLPGETWDNTLPEGALNIGVNSSWDGSWQPSTSSASTGMLSQMQASSPAAGTPSSSAAPTSTSPTGTTSPTGQTPGDEAIKAWFAATNPTNAQVAQKAAELGLTSADITHALTVGRGFAPQSVDAWVANPASGYTWDANGRLIARPPTVGAAPPPPAPRPIGTGWTGGAGAPTGMPAFTLGAIQGPSTWDVAANQTAASQLENILRSDSPLMQQARTRAMQEMATRGGVNTTMAATAGESAMIDHALPIALHDASTFADAAHFNADSSNTFSREANAYTREQEMANFNVSANDWAAGRAFTRGESAADSAFGRSQTAATTAFERSQTAADTQFQHDLALQQDRIGTGTQSDLTRGYMNSINQARTDYASALANISSSTTMDSALKTETLTNLRNTYNTMIENYARLLGWNPASWLIETSPIGAPPPAPTNASTDNGGGG